MHRTSHPLFTAPLLGLGVLAMAGILACSGTSSTNAAATPVTPAVATHLTYVAPSTTGYRLVADPSSTATHLVLNLVGPSGDTAQGVIFKASCDGRKTTWTAPTAGSTLAQPGTALNLGAGVPLLQAKAVGQELQVALFQKGGAAAATLGTAPLLSVALDLKAGTEVGKLQLLVWPECRVVDATGANKAIVVTAGTLTAN